jgi:5-enolpyruvylshikimate-3-phosphate synthase
VVIHGGTLLDPHDDCRLAMSLVVVVGLKVPEIIITNEKCVNKLFPGFWQIWDEL